MSDTERTALEITYDDRISRLRTALDIGMPAAIVLSADTGASMAMDALREQHRRAVEDRAALTRGLANAARALEECGQTRSAASAWTIIAASGGQ